jgi:hypothetical protein
VHRRTAEHEDPIETIFLDGVIDDPPKAVTGVVPINVLLGDTPLGNLVALSVQ